MAYIGPQENATYLWRAERLRKESRHICCETVCGKCTQEWLLQGVHGDVNGLHEGARCRDGWETWQRAKLPVPDPICADDHPGPARPPSCPTAPASRM